MKVLKSFQVITSHLASNVPGSIKKDSEIVHVSGVDKNRLVSSVKHQSPDVGTWDNFEPTELEYEDEKVLEKRRAALQRELHLQMKKDGSRKEVVKVSAVMSIGFPIIHNKRKIVYCKIASQFINKNMK